MKIRKMRIEDVEDFLNCQANIWEKLRESLPQEFVESNLNWIRRQGAKDSWIKAIGEPNWILLVAEKENSIVGMATGRVDWSHLSQLGFLGVDPNHRRKGIARSLVKKFMKESKNLGAVKISLETSPSLKPAIKLYADMGFFPEGFLKSHRMGEDIIIYSYFLH